MVDEAYERTLGLVRDKMDQVESVAQALLEKETISHDDVVELIGHRPFRNNQTYEDYVNSAWKKKDGAGADDKGEKDADDKGAVPGNLNPSF